jgi:hypothetical protein
MVSATLHSVSLRAKFEPVAKSRSSGTQKLEKLAFFGQALINFSTKGVNKARIRKRPKVTTKDTYGYMLYKQWG